MRRVAIVAKAGTSALAPWLDHGWEIWGMPWVSYPRVDRLFDYHTQEFHDGLSPDSEVAEWSAKNAERYAPVPTYCEESRVHAYKKGIRYPIEGVMRDLQIPFLENTVAYQIALAIFERVDEIGLYGVHMMSRKEFEAERPSVTYLVGLAQGRGIEVTVAPGSPLFLSRWEHGRYGFGKKRRMPVHSNHFGG